MLNLHLPLADKRTSCISEQTTRELCGKVTLLFKEHLRPLVQPVSASAAAHLNESSSIGSAAKRPLLHNDIFSFEGLVQL